MHLIPAYGRDYKSKKEVEADWKADKDFLISDISSPDNGRYINRSQVKEPVYIRYNKLRKVCVIQP